MDKIKITTFDADGAKTSEIEADADCRFDIAVRDATVFVSRPIVEIAIAGDLPRGTQTRPYAPPPPPSKRRR